jgi:hypothetical protein
MSDYSFLRSSPFVLRGDQDDLEQIPDEVFLDIQGARDTQLLTIGCYDQAVKECIVMGDDCFLLKIRPDMRGLLMSQLRPNFRVYRTYTYPRKPETRLILTEDLSIRFKPGASPEERRDCLERYFVGAEETDGSEEFLCRLRPHLADDPLAAHGTICGEATIQDAGLNAYAFPIRALLTT